MTTGWSGEELARLRMSVGYGGHKKGRPLSPIEVGRTIQRALDRQATLKDCADALQLKGTGHIGRFLRILRLPEDIYHDIVWGVRPDAIGFTVAVEMTSVKEQDDQLAIANAVRANGLTSKEVRQVAQLLRRQTEKDVEWCIASVLAMRNVLVKRYALLGSVSSVCGRKLSQQTQRNRDELLMAALDAIGLRNAEGRLGTKMFTLTGDASFNHEMNKIGKEDIEKKIDQYIRQHVS